MILKERKKLVKERKSRSNLQVREKEAKKRREERDSQSREQDAERKRKTRADPHFLSIEASRRREQRDKQNVVAREKQARQARNEVKRFSNSQYSASELLKVHYSIINNTILLVYNTEVPYYCIGRSQVRPRKFFDKNSS